MKYICPNTKIHLFKLTNIFVQIIECICCCGVSVLYDVDESIWPDDPNQSRRRFILRNYNNRTDDWFRLLYKKPQKTDNLISDLDSKITNSPVRI